MKYKKNFEQTLDRLKKFYNTKMESKILARMNIESKVLNKFKEEHKAGLCSYPDPVKRIEFWDAFLKERKDIIDDSIPSVYLTEFDQGLYGALVGGDIRFNVDPDNGWISSMVPPIIESWQEFDQLIIDYESGWLEKYKKQLDIYSRWAEDKFGISHFILIDSLNFVYELRGATQTYLDVEQNPGRIKQAKEFAFKLNTFIQDLFFEGIDLIAGGTCSNAGEWIPGIVITESVDPFHMTSADYFEEWGKKEVEKIFNYYDGGIVHIHANGRHLVESVAEIEGLKGILFLDDLGYPSSFSLRHQLRKRAGDMPLILYVDYEEFIIALQDNDLAGGILYQVTDVPDVETANRCFEKVRNIDL